MASSQREVSGVTYMGVASDYVDKVHRVVLRAEQARRFASQQLQSCLCENRVQQLRGNLATAAESYVFILG